MNLVSGSRLWIDKNPIPHKYTYLSENTDCDIAIIGAGIIGAICAYYLTSAGIDTIILDKNIIGYSSTSASTSLLQYEIDYDLIGLEGLLGTEKAVKSFKLVEKAVNDIQNIINTLQNKCDFTLRECLYYTTNKSDVRYMQKEYSLRKAHGFNVEFLDKTTASEMFSFPVEAGVYSISGGAEIDPYQFSHELISNSVNKGLRVFENTEITKINPGNNMVELITQNEKRIKAKKVVIATGYEGKKLIKKKFSTLNRTFTIVTKPVNNFDGWNNRCLIRDNINPYTYLRTTADNRIIIGGDDVKTGGKNSKMSLLLNCDQLLEDKYSILLNKLKSMFPMIKDIQAQYEFTGLFAETKDGLPYIGEYKTLPNCYFCLCYGSNGILYGVLGAQVIRDLYYGNYSEETRLFRFER